MRERGGWIACLALLAASACTTQGEIEAQRARQEANACTDQVALHTVEQRASKARIEQLEAEIRRLQSDLAQAQQVIVDEETLLH